MKKNGYQAWRNGLSPYKKDLLELMEEIGEGGWINAHAHLDRANTNQDAYWQHCGINPEEASSFSLKVKQALTGELHKGPAYKLDDLVTRLSALVEQSIFFRVKSLTTFVDVSDDIGLRAVQAAVQVKKKYRERINFRLGVQPIFGFKNYTKTDRWDLHCQAVTMPEVDILGGLPEVDNDPDRIGFEEHCYLIIKKAISLGKEVHIHVDQKNSPRENGTERVIKVVEAIDREIRAESLGQNNFSSVSPSRPFLWLIHMISPSSYEEKRFQTLLANLKKYHLGVICCPRAAISMLQLRPLNAPVHNSIARLLDLVKTEIPVEIGTDNVGDIFIPTGDINMLEEVALLPDLLRYYVKKTLVKIACGIKLNNMDLELVSRSLYQDKKSFDRLRG